MQCRECNSPIPAFRRSCPACEADAGFPNVRAALAPDNVAALQARVTEAEQSCDARNCGEELTAFREAVAEQSFAMICQPIERICDLVTSDLAAYTTFHQQVAEGRRMPQNNIWDEMRASVDAALFPNYHKHIRFAFLSMMDTPMGYYGNCAMVLKPDLIASRATTFDDNSFEFCRDVLKLTLGQPIPPGYSAAWGSRGDHAAAKLHAEIDPGIAPDQFGNVLFADSPTDPRFVEVHVYGSINRRSIDRILISGKLNRAQQVFRRQIEEAVDDLDVAVELVA